MKGRRAAGLMAAAVLVAVGGGGLTRWSLVAGLVLVVVGLLLGALGWLGLRRGPAPGPPVQDAPTAPTVEYFCYISRAKVDQLYEQIEPEAGYEITELRSTESTVRADAGAEWGIPHVVKLFRAGASYGRTGKIQREAKVKRSYLQKLERVLLAIASDGSIPDARQALSNGSPRSGGFLHHHGPFRVEPPVTTTGEDAVVTLVSKVGNRRLLLDCSLRNFSEGPGPDGRFMLNSANQRFFTGGIPLSMTTIFLVLDVSGRRIVGTPLFLKLALTDAAALTAL
jgi:hypothetical protein